MTDQSDQAQADRDSIRPLSFQRDYTSHPGGSVLIAWGQTRVLCTAMLEKGVPPWLAGSGKGWLTAEYAMLPSSTPGRRTRDVSRGRPDGRATEIQRLIGRSLRIAVDRERFPDRTLWVDCDVLQADGGTRTAAINGAWVAVHDAFRKAVELGELASHPIVEQVAAVSVGVVGGGPVLDLEARQDQAADVDMNIVMTGSGQFIEVQGSAERSTFGGEQLDQLLSLARSGVERILAAQLDSLGSDA